MHKLSYDIELNNDCLQISNILRKIFEHENVETFYIEWLENYNINNQFLYIAGKNYSLDDLILIIKEVLNEEVSMQFVIGNIFCLTVDSSYLYIETNHELKEIIENSKLNYYSSSGREKVILHLKDDF